MKTAVVVILSIVSLHAIGQREDIRKVSIDSSRLLVPTVLDSVAVSIQRRQQSRELISATLLKANPSQNFADLLQKQSGIFIRKRGSAVLSTPSYKGLGTMQIPVLINGANMQSSMNGSIDLSIIDAVHFGGLELGDAAPTTLGAQNMGDAIQLSSLSSKNGLRVGISYSTQEEWSTNAKYVAGKNKWYYSLSATGTQSENVVDMKRYGIDSIQSNTDFRRASLLQTVGYKWEKSHWTNTVYLQASERGVPPPFYQTNDSRQKDVNTMMINTYRHRLKRKNVLKIANQLWREQIVFDNKQDNEITNNEVWNANTSVSLKKYFRNGWYASVGTSLDIAHFNSEAIAQPVEWNRPRVYSTLTKNWKKIQLSFNQNTVRYLENIETSGGITVEGHIAKLYHCKAKAQRVYRLPVLNELYWYMPGQSVGNPLLKPEEGFKIDMEFSRWGKNVQLSLNPHAGTYQNWIQWVGATEYTPENIQNVLVYGAILTANHEKKIKEWTLHTQANMNYVSATYSFDDESDSRHNKQIIYTPSLTGNITVTLAASHFGIYANAQFVGYNYVTSDHSSYIEPYQLYEFGGYYEWNRLRVGAVLTNALDAPYFTQPRTPLPGRVLKININYIFNTSKS